MQFGKRAFFLLLNGAALLVVLLYLLFWLMGNSTGGRILRPLHASSMTVQYVVGEKTYTERFMRSDVPLSQTSVKVRYQPWNPSMARIQSFMGLLAEPLAWWGVVLLAIAMLLLTNNTVFSKGTRFRLQQRFPWLMMDEFFPSRVHDGHSTYPRPTGAKKLPDGWRQKKDESA